MKPTFKINEIACSVYRKNEKQRNNCSNSSDFVGNKLKDVVEVPYTYFPLGFPVSDGKEFAYNEGDLSSIPESRRSPGEGNGFPFQYSCLENPTDRGDQRATVHGVANSSIYM